MASVALANVSSPPQAQSEYWLIGIATMNSEYRKTHAISKVIFNKSRTKASLYFKNDNIRDGWPDIITSSHHPFPRDPTTISPGFHIQWSVLIAPFMGKYAVFLESCSWRVEKIKVIFDSKETYENPLFKDATAAACKILFPNLKSGYILFPPA